MSAMEVVARAGREDVAFVYVARTDRGRLVEFVESVQPPLRRHQKWVLIVSTLDGCPIGCRFCDAGGFFGGRLSAREIFDQIDDLVRRRFPDGRVAVEKFKIQFARMGEPALNPSILDVLEELPRAYDAPGLVISLSTVAPASERRRVLRAALGDQEEALRGAIPAPVLDPHDGWALENAARSGQDLGFREDGRIRARVP
ncbi:MAG TPA: hypothetical protein PLL55_12205 [Candidatus Aminicenantes bacterium]|nr:hypothetical protein [Candidatus Aminicenantes bacterium]